MVFRLKDGCLLQAGTFSTRFPTPDCWEHYLAIDPAGLRQLSVLLRDPELRAVDAWMPAAKEAKHPTPMQSLIRRLAVARLPESQGVALPWR